MFVEIQFVTPVTNRIGIATRSVTQERVTNRVGIFTFLKFVELGYQMCVCVCVCVRARVCVYVCVCVCVCCSSSSSSSGGTSPQMPPICHPLVKMDLSIVLCIRCCRRTLTLTSSTSGHRRQVVVGPLRAA